MAAASAQMSTSTKDCMAKIDRIIENALGNETSGKDSRMGAGILMESKGIGDFSPSSSPARNSLSKLGFSPARDNIHRSSLSGIGNSESPLKTYDPEVKPSNQDSFLSNTTKESRYTSASDISDNWVNYQFDRLVTDRRNNSKFKSNDFSSSMPQAHKVNNVEDILREYGSSEPMYGKSGFRNNSLFKSGFMNRSHNNEALNYLNPETEQVRRVGSSVDGNVGDVLKSFGAKCSLSGTGCSSSQMLNAEENKSLGLPRDSEVDFKPSSSSSGRLELSEIRTDLSDLNYSFQKERERLRHLESLIRKTPTGSSHGPEAILNLKTPNYSSRFLNEYSGRKTFSGTDYSKYSTSDYSDYLSRASSSASYKNMGTYSPTAITNYRTNYNPMQYTPSGLDATRVPTMTTQRSDTHESETDPVGHPAFNYSNYPKSSGSSSLNKTKLNRSLSVKKDRNMSRCQPEIDTGKRKNSVTKSFTKRPSPPDSRRWNTRDGRQSLAIQTENKNRNKQMSPNSPKISDIIRRESKTDTERKTKLNTKYQPYLPCVMPQEQFSPKQTKSELTTKSMTPWMNHFSRFYGHEKPESEIDQQKRPWSSALSSSESTPTPMEDWTSKPLGTYEQSGNGNEATISAQQHKNRGKRCRKNMRSKSECRVSNRNVTAWSMQPQDNFALGNALNTFQSHRPPLQVKTTGRKLKPKAKKGTSGVRLKKKSTKQK